jgi:hypothetical protein
VNPGTPPTSGSSSQSISAAGGSLSASAGAQTVTITVPAGAVASATTFTATVFTDGSMPKPLASSQRKTMSLPAGASPVIEVLIDTSPPATLLKPLKLSLANPGPASGSIYRLAGYGNNGFNDVDTVTWAPGGPNVGVATEDNNVKYANASSAKNTLYGFYIIPAASAAAPPAITSAAVGPTSVQTGVTAQYTGAGSDANGFPVLNHAYTFSISNPAMGSITPAGALTPGPNDVTGNVIATDTTTTATPGALAVHVSSSRPNQAVDAFLFTGTLVTTLTAQQPPTPPSGAPGPPVSSTTTAQVVQNIASAGSTDGVNYTLNNDEFDNESLRSTEIKTATTLAYTAAGSVTTVRIAKEVSNDSNGVQYRTTYGPNNGKLTTLPETAGTLNNDAQLVYEEVDPGNTAIDPATGNPVSIQRKQAGDGSYTENVVNTNGIAFYGANADGTGVAIVGGGATEYDFFPPTSSGGGTFIPIDVFNVANNGTKTRNGAQRQVFPWYGNTVPPVMSSDTVTITPSSALDATCPASAAFARTTGATATMVTESYKAYDYVLGQIETRTIKTFDVAGPGTVCVVLNDRIDTWYDYSGQEGNITQKRPTTATPFQTTVVTETLGQQVVANTPTSNSRSVKSVTARVPVIASLRARFAHVVEKAKADQARRLATFIRNARGTN